MAKEINNELVAKLLEDVAALKEKTARLEKDHARCEELQEKQEEKIEALESYINGIKVLRTAAITLGAGVAWLLSISPKFSNYVERVIQRIFG